jgi:Flp pilus assembly CpaE family ATPase
MAQEIVLPVTPDIAALKTVVNAMRILKAVNIDASRIRVVLNEIVPRAGLSRQQVEKSLGTSPVSIPHAGSMFIDALNHGMPVVTFEQPNPVSKALIDLARLVCESEETESAGKTRSGLFGRLRHHS